MKTLTIKKETTGLTNKKCESYINQNNCYISKKEFEDADNINYHRVRDHCHYKSK